MLCNGIAVDVLEVCHYLGTYIRTHLLQLYNLRIRPTEVPLLVRYCFAPGQVTLGFVATVVESFPTYFRIYLSLATHHEHVRL